VADSIRHRIVHGGVNGPSKFTHGKKILKFIPDIFATLEKSTTILNLFLWCSLIFPSAISSMKLVLISSRFVLHLLYGICCAHAGTTCRREGAHNYTAQCTSQDATYGVILQAYLIRYLDTLSFSFLGAQGLSFTKSLIGNIAPPQHTISYVPCIYFFKSDLLENNYPKVLGELYITNSLMVFNAFFLDTQQESTPSDQQEVASSY
jgi:hypothetical protein